MALTLPASVFCRKHHVWSVVIVFCVGCQESQTHTFLNWCFLNGLSVVLQLQVGSRWQPAAPDSISSPASSPPICPSTRRTSRSSEDVLKRVSFCGARVKDAGWVWTVVCPSEFLTHLHVISLTRKTFRC